MSLVFTLMLKCNQMILSRFFNYVSRARYILLGAGAGIIWLLTIVFLLLGQQTINFQYAETSCTNRLTAYPSLMQAVGDSHYTVSYNSVVSLGNTPLLANKTCVEPTVAPTAGTYDMKIALFGWSWLAQTVHIKVPEAPVADTTPFFNKTIATTRALAVPLSTPDRIYDYRLTVQDKSVICVSDSAEIKCDIPALKLNQGREYQAKLERQFQEKTVATLATGRFTTLKPLKITASTLKNKQTIYSKPTEFRFTFDKPLGTATARLQRVNDAEVATTTVIKDKTVTVKLPQQLNRKASFVLTLPEVIAKDGSTTDGIHTVNFKTSGGPEVTNVSVGSLGLDPNQQIVVTLDQPMAKDVDVASFASIAGAKASIVKLSDTQIVYNLQNAPRCAAFSLNLAKGIPSGSNDEKSDETWSFNGRVVCGTSSVIGYSVRGRPIIAYYFGSGNKTILFTGGIHGEEASGYLTMQGWVNYLNTYAYQLPADKTVVVVPNVNPDGIAIGQRYNANNVNLGRNFPSANWTASAATPSGTLPEGGGKTPGSEPETKALMNLTRQLRPRLEVSFHAQGSLVGANKVADSVSLGNTYASIVGYGTMFYNAEEIMGYTITGEYEEWMGEELGTPAILIELPTHDGNYFSSQLPALLRMLNI